MTNNIEISNATLATLVNVAPDGLMVLSNDGEISYINRAGALLLGSTQRSLLGSHFGIPVTSDGSAEINISKGPNRTDVGVCELRVAPIDIDNHSPDAIVVSLRDITELKAAKSEAQAAQKTAEVAEQAKTQLLWRTSHELRTPLSALIGFADLLAETDLDEVQRSMLKQISFAGLHLREVIDDVLSTAELDSDNVQISLEPVLLSKALHEAVELIQPSVDKAGLALTLDDSVEANTYIKADGRRLRQVLLNLLSNAVKYNSAKGTVSVHAERTAGEFVRIAITDHGAGLDSDRLARLFVPFDRLGAEHSTVAGTGLGLTVAKGLTEAMGGTIGVESKVGHGCSFWIDLRLMETDSQ